MLDGKRPFTRADAIAAGIDPRRLNGSRFRRIFRGVYIDASVPQSAAERAEAALLLHPEGAWASHQTAAKWCGVVVPPTSTTHVSVTRAQDRRWQPGLKPHVAPPHTRTQMVRGLRVSEPVRMFVELASVLDLVDLVVAGDALVRVFGMRASDLCQELDRTRDYWSPAARHAASYVRDEVDSPMESRLRMLLVLAGLPEPKVNHIIRGPQGEIIVRFDLSYPRVRTIVEYDGRQHVEIIENWEDDLDRREYLDGQKWRVIKVTSQGIYVEPGRTIDRVCGVLRERGVAIPRLVDDWRPFFPGRKRAA